jgi:hypothetical protein
MSGKYEPADHMTSGRQPLKDSRRSSVQANRSVPFAALPHGQARARYPQAEVPAR